MNIHKKETFLLLQSNKYITDCLWLNSGIHDSDLKMSQATKVIVLYKNITVINMVIQFCKWMLKFYKKYESSYTNILLCVLDI